MNLYGVGENYLDASTAKYYNPTEVNGESTLSLFTDTVVDVHEALYKY